MNGQVALICLNCDRCGKRFEGTMQRVGREFETTGFVLTRFRPGLMRSYSEHYLCQECVDEQTKAKMVRSVGILETPALSEPPAET